MNPHISSKEQFDTEVTSETVSSETEVLTECGFTTDEIISLCWLREWYPSGGSDRIEIIRRLEFLKLLISSGKIEP